MNKIFKDNPKLQEYYETSDKTKFYNEDLAKNHARNLPDRRVKTVHRGDEPTETQEEPVVTTPIVEKVKKEMITKTEGPITNDNNRVLTEGDAGTVDSKDLTPMAAAKLRAEAIEKLDTVEAVEKALDGETAKSVKTAGQNRIAAIKASKALDSKKDNDNVTTK